MLSSVREVNRFLWSGRSVKIPVAGKGIIRADTAFAATDQYVVFKNRRSPTAAVKKNDYFRIGRTGEGHAWREEPEGGPGIGWMNHRPIARRENAPAAGKALAARRETSTATG